MKVNGTQYRAVWWDGGAVGYIDQRLLPHRFETVTAGTTHAVADAITGMAVRGAPTIGVMAGYGLALASMLGENLESAYGLLNSTRPTAVNLRAGLDAVAPHFGSPDAALKAARAHDDAEVVAAERIGEFGRELIKDGARISTHCNAGWLAAQDWGTALSPIYKAAEEGLSVHVYVNETRPRLQGARLTAWELGQNGIPHQVVADGATASLIRRGLVDLVITGADRIAANGDAANKIGTYPLALAAHANGVPFYVAAPLTTIDPDVATGDDIPIEQRPQDEVLYADGLTESGESGRVRLAPESSPALNPAFDVTPAELITGLITDAGIVDASPEGIRRALSS